MPDRQCLDHAHWGLDEYRRELLELAESRYSGRWSTAEIKNQAMDHTTNAEDVVKHIEQVAPRLLGLFRFATKPISHSTTRPRKDIDKVTLWVSIFAILCYTEEKNLTR